MALKRRALHARHRQRRLSHTLPQVRPVLLRHAAALCVHVHDQNRIRIEPETHVGKRRERPDEKAGADDEHERQRNLQDDHRAAEAEARLADNRASLFLQRVVRLHARRAQRGNRSEEQRRRHRDKRGEHEDAPVDPDVERDWRIVDRQLAYQQRGAPAREQRARASAPADREHGLSASSWRAMRQRDAPSATRTLNSCRRALARASSRFAMLAQAISSTSATTPMMRRAARGTAARDRSGPLAAGAQAERIASGTAPRSRVGSSAAAWPRGSAAARRAAPTVARSIESPGFQPRDDAQPPPRALIHRALPGAANQRLGAERHGHVVAVTAGRSP